MTATRSECAILAGMAQATLPESRTPWQDYVDDYDRIRDTMAQVLDGFEDFNARARHPHGFRIAQPARGRVFQTPSGRAEFSLALLPDMPELNVLCGIADVSTQSEQPVTKHLVVEVTSSHGNGAAD